MEERFETAVGYKANQNDPWSLHQYASCDIRLANPLWPVGKQRTDLPIFRRTREPGDCLSSRRLGPKGGPEWPYWHHQMWEYMGAHF